MSQNINTALTISRPSTFDGDRFIEIRLKDEASRIEFICVKVDLASFTEALTGLAHIECKAEIRGFESVGKQREVLRGNAFISEEEYSEVTGGSRYSSHKEALGQWLKDNHSKEGWNLDAYLGSQNSIVYREGGKVLHFGYYRFV